MPKFEISISSNYKNKLEISDSRKVIETNKKSYEERIRVNRELIENITKIIPKEIYDKNEKLVKKVL